MPNAEVKMKKGATSSSNTLPNSTEEGTLYFDTTDKAIYLDTATASNNNNRIKFSDWMHTVNTTDSQTIGGTKTFSETINGTITNATNAVNASNAATATSLATAPTLTQGGGSSLTLAANTFYTLSVGNKDLIFKTPVDSDTWIANSVSTNGYVTAGNGYENKVWKTNSSGEPAWRDDANTDTKNTAGSTQSSSQLYLIGATAQSANSQTYSNSKVYINNNQLYSNEERVIRNSELYYQAGDTYILNNSYTVLPGYITTSSSAMIFNIKLPKSMGTLTPTINDLCGVIRSSFFLDQSTTNNNEPFIRNGIYIGIKTNTPGTSGLGAYSLTGSTTALPYSTGLCWDALKTSNFCDFTTYKIDNYTIGLRISVGSAAASSKFIALYKSSHTALTEQLGIEALNNVPVIFQIMSPPSDGGYGAWKALKITFS